MKLIILCICLLPFLSSAFFITQNDDRVKVDFYYESQCNACRIFMKKSLAVAASTKDFWKICDFTMYPYGNAKRHWNGTAWNFTCQHGRDECFGNLVEVCTIKKYDFHTQAIPFILCLQDNYDDFNKGGIKCSSHLGLDWNMINHCATTKEGREYLLEVAEATEKLQPAHTYVPWVVIDGIHKESDEDSLLANMVNYVCKAYTGSIQIDACK